MSRYDWRLLINLKDLPKKKPDYEKDYIFNRSNLRICIYKEGVCVHWYKTSVENGWNPDSVSGRKYFNDAIRKANLLYALQYGKGLVIKKYTVWCGYIVRTIEEKDSPDFPYMCSMMQGVDYAVEPEEFGSRGIFGNTAIMDHVALGKWSDDHSDEKKIALYAYLQSRGRYFEVDRFLNLWTAMNAVYCHICNEHKREIERRAETISDEELAPLVADEQAIKRDLKKLMSSEEIPDKESAKKILARRKLISAYTAAEHADGEQRSYLLRLAHQMKSIPYRSQGGVAGKLEQFLKDVHKDYYSVHIERHNLKDGRVKYTSQKLYERVMGIQNGEWSEKEEELFAELAAHIEGFGITLFAFMTFDMPYMERNKLIHGSEATLLLADYYQINRIACLNYFMDRFLAEYIPYLFDEEKTEEMISIINPFIYNRRKQDENTKGTLASLRKIIPKEKRKEQKWLDGEWE